MAEQGEEYTDDNGIADELAQLNALAELMPELADDEDLKNLSAIVNKTVSPVEATGEESEEEEEEDEEEDEDENENEEESDDEEEEDEDEEDENDIFGLNSKKKQVEVDFELGEEAKKYLKEKYAIEDESKFFNSVDKWRGDAQKYSEVEGQYNELQEGLSSLPDQIKSAINAFANGGDFIEAFGAEGRIDFSKNFEDQDEDDVARHYYKDDYNAIIKSLDDGDLSDEEADARIKLLSKASAQVYKRDKASIEDTRAGMIKEQQGRVKVVKETASSSVDFLKEKFPNFKQSDLQRIQRVLVDGNLESRFYNKDGSVKKEAAVKLAMAEYYENILERVKGVSENKGKTEANLDIAERGKKKLTKSKSTAAVQQERKAEDAVSHLSAHMQEDPYA